MVENSLANAGDREMRVWEDPCRRVWQLTAQVLLPEESHGQRILAGYSSQGLKELDTTEASERFCPIFKII